MWREREREERAHQIKTTQLTVHAMSYLLDAAPDECVRAVSVMCSDLSTCEHMCMLREHECECVSMHAHTMLALSFLFGFHQHGTTFALTQCLH